MTAPTPLPARRGLNLDVLAAAALALFVLLLYARLLFTNRVLASGDILLYFYPYREAVAAALREGRVPFWNPYIFLGAPLLANPQAAVLYPLHWPLIWLPATEQVYWSAALHTWLLGLGGYLLLRGWGHSRWAALVAGLCLAGSGFVGGLIGHINQLNGVAWLPWALWMLARIPAAGAPAVARRLAGATGLFGLLVALMLLAGHTQTVFINLAGLGLWAVWPIVSWRSPWPVRLAPIGPRLAVYVLGTGLGLLASAAQLLPTLELSGLGLRSGGLSYAEATSFSLRPLLLPWTLLPSYGLVDLSVVFGTLGYTEYVAYVGSLGLALAALGAVQGFRKGVREPAWQAGLLLAALGLFLAAGRWNPVYFLLYGLVPGFDLFRVPARWMMLYTLGMALLVAVGVDHWRSKRPVIGRPARLLPPALALILALDLILAARSLPHTHPTAPQAVYEVRTAPAHLLTDPVRAALHPAAAGRFLSLSAITFDPGDMADYRRVFRTGPNPPLDEAAFEQLIIALKAQEILAPNLALFWRVPGVDGFDGGVLPLRRYLDLLTLFVPPGELVPDGRLREQLQAIPDARLLALLNVQYVITDKVRDLWFQDIYYDRQIGARLDESRPLIVIESPTPFAATHLHLIATLAGDAAALDGGNRAIATVTVQSEGGDVRLPIIAGDQPGAQVADEALDSPLAEAVGAQVAYRDVEGGRQEYLVALSLPEPMRPATITVALQDSPLPLMIQAATLVDGRTGMFQPLLPSDRGRFRLVHSGDVKIYENLDVLPRAYLVHSALAAPDAASALDRLAALDFDPAQAAVVEGLDSFTNAAAPGDAATITAYAPERVAVQTRSQAPALLVLGDTAYPGWTATVDGAPAPIHRANALFRGVVVPAGEHTVVFTYRPTRWSWAVGLSALGVLLIAGCALMGSRE
ncbi:MAG TPA: YfhO family protein [Caldilineaceae bacterium]|nr:YfhO family protein [Caldilineaceae bacterium]